MPAFSDAFVSSERTVDGHTGPPRRGASPVRLARVPAARSLQRAEMTFWPRSVDGLGCRLGAIVVVALAMPLDAADGCLDVAVDASGHRGIAGEALATWDAAADRS